MWLRPAVYMLRAAGAKQVVSNAALGLKISHAKAQGRKGSASGSRRGFLCAFAPLRGKFLLRMGEICSSDLHVRISERKSQAELNFATRSRRFSDSAKLRRVYEAVGSSQIAMVERVESLGANLQLNRFGHGKFTL